MTCLKLNSLYSYIIAPWGKYLGGGLGGGGEGGGGCGGGGEGDGGLRQGKTSEQFSHSHATW